MKLIELLRIIRNIIYTFFWGIYLYIINKKKKFTGEKIIYAECYLKYRGFKIVHQNWGDDLNKYFISNIIKERIVFVPFEKLLRSKRSTHYELIGSIIGFYDLNDKIIWGSGIMKPEDKIRGIPKKVISVRGPKTREILLDNGIECPERYGDPALILPLFYDKKVKRDNCIAIIPNMGTNIKNVKKWIKNSGFNEKVKIIDMRKYKKWTDIIDEIRSSKYVISESLHGLIVAETYNIPNIWVEFMQHGKYWNFKFQDYYLSIGKENMDSLKLYTENINLNDIINIVHSWEKGYIDYNTILDSIPFTVKNIYEV